MRKTAIYQVDAFTPVPCRGNPAAVCLLENSTLPLSDETRQAVAQEMNLSETAFVECLSPEDSFETASRFNLRWFTPTVEVPLCGHATFAAAAALFLGSGNTSDSLTFSTLSGDLHVARTLGDVRRGLGAAARMQMELPCARPDDQVPDGASEMASALCGDLPVEDVRFAASLRYLLVALRPGCVDAGGLGAHKVNVAAMQQTGAGKGDSIAAVIVSCCAAGAVPNGQPRVFSRFFAPWLGVEEDPVTGSAHSVLVPYYSDVLGDGAIQFRQCSQRTGDLHGVLESKEGQDRVVLTGDAVLVMSGVLALPEDAPSH